MKTLFAVTLFVVATLVLAGQANAGWWMLYSDEPASADAVQVSAEEALLQDATSGVSGVGVAGHAIAGEPLSAPVEESAPQAPAGPTK